MRLMLLLVFVLSGCASSVVSLKHEAPLEVYVVTSKEDWMRVTDLIFNSGDAMTIQKTGFQCAHELKRDLHQCFYFSTRPLAEICSSAQAAIENELGSQLAQRLKVRYSACEGGSSKQKPLFVVPFALVFDAQVRFDLTYNRVSYGTRCANGKTSRSTGRGTCSWNGGVAGTTYGWVLDGELGNNLQAAYSNPDRFQRR